MKIFERYLETIFSCEILWDHIPSVVRSCLPLCSLSPPLPPSSPPPYPALTVLGTRHSMICLVCLAGAQRGAVLVPHEVPPSSVAQHTPVRRRRSVRGHHLPSEGELLLAVGRKRSVGANSIVSEGVGEQFTM